MMRIITQISADNTFISLKVCNAATFEGAKDEGHRILSAAIS